MGLSDLHSMLGNAFSLFALIIAGWALLHLAQRREIGGNFWGAVVIGEGLVAVQALIGLIMVLQGLRPARDIHFLYGIVALLSWPALFAISKGGTGRRETIFWVLVSVFLFGIILRATATAG
jgi:uncharacterized membrane protein